MKPGINVTLRRLPFLLAPLMLLSACASKLELKSANVSSDVTFCSVAKKEWGESVPGDPVRTKAQKAAFNTTGTELECWN